MAQSSPQNTQRPLSIVYIHHSTDPYLDEFLSVCESNDASIALQLGPDREASALTVGLNRAIREGHLDLARQLLHLGAVWDSRTIHHISGSLEAVKLLVQSGFDVNTGMKGGGVLLNMVVLRNDEACIRYLLEHGANPNLGPPLITYGDFMEDILPSPTSGCNLNCAAGWCTPETFALLLSYGAEVSNAIPLHYAAGHNRSPYEAAYVTSPSRVPMLEYLLSLGLNIDVLDNDFARRGRQFGTPLHYAVKWRRQEEAKWLLEKGADPDIKAVCGMSVRDRAKRLPDEHPLRELLCAPE